VPLKAIIDCRTVIGPELSQEAWNELAVRHRHGLAVTMACCGAPGHLRTSGRGLRHFYHATGSGCHYAEESKEHLAIKYLVYRASVAEGWETQVECPSPDRSWIADVSATKGGRTVVFEVQVSPISPAELAERDAHYQNAGIESYWLLADFPNRSRVLAAWYDTSLAGDGGPRAEDVFSIDRSLFSTGPENHLFSAKSIRSAGLRVKDQSLFTTNNPEIPIAVWVREVLNGNYLRYLEETRAAISYRRRLLILAAPLLERLHAFYPSIRDRTFHKRLASLARTRQPAQSEPEFRKRSAAIASEIDWIEKEYRSMMAEESGLFFWKSTGKKSAMRPVFRLESEKKVRQLEERIAVIDRWESSFNAAMRTLEQDGSDLHPVDPDQE
jgi:competence protein CoiA